MNAETLQFINSYAPTATTLRVFFPEIVLAILAMFTLVVDVISPRDNLKIGRSIASCGMLFAALMSFAQMLNWPPMDVGNEYSVVALFSTILIGCGFLTIRLTGVVAKRAEFSGPITNCLIIIATAAASILFKQADFLWFFVSLETLTILLYALVGSCRGNVASLEAGVKYLIAGAVSGAMLLFGIMLLYGFVALTGNYGSPIEFQALTDAIAKDSSNPMAIAGAMMVLGGVMFKFGILPMNFWIPDTYQGAPMHVTFFLATLSKATGLFAMFFFLIGVFLPLFDALFPVLVVLAILSMIVANVTALGQQNVKRLLGLSGASHASYLMLVLLAIMKYTHNSLWDASYDNTVFVMMFGAVILYMVFYVLSLYPIFSAMAHVPAHKGCEQELHIDDFAAMSSRSPLLATALTTGIASLAGIPPTVGFIAKLALLWVLFYAEMYVPAIIMLICVGGSVYYYFAWARKFYEKSDLPELKVAKSTTIRAFWLAGFSALTVVGCVLYFVLFGLIA